MYCILSTVTEKVFKGVSVKLFYVYDMMQADVGCAVGGRIRIAVACHIKRGPIPPLFPGRA